MRCYYVAFAIFALAACSDGPKSSDTIMNVDENMMTTDAETSPTEQPKETHNYDDKEGTLYSYIGAVSEEDQKKGQVTGAVVTYAYRGMNNGLYRLDSIDGDGRTRSYAECAKPCVIIKAHFGSVTERMAYNPKSIIGSAFEDALNGRLEVTPLKPKPKPQPLTGRDEVGGDAGHPEFEPDPTADSDASVANEV